VKPSSLPAIRNRITGHGDVDPAQLLANARNFRRHPNVQRDALRGSLDELGWLKTIIVNESTGNVVDGHARIEEALQRREPLVPVTYINLTEAEERLALAVLDEISAMAVRDDDALAALLGEIETTDTALTALLDSMQPADAGSSGILDGMDPDDVPDPPPVPRSRLGDIYQLGNHRLVCGDSADAAVWESLMAGRGGADMLWTDPPYGVAYVGKTKDALTIENDALSTEGLSDLLRAVFDLALVHGRPGGAWYVASPAGPLQETFGALLIELGVMRQCLAWVKDQFVMGRSDYHYRHEPVYYGWKPGAAHRWFGGRDKDSVLDEPRPRRSVEHPTMKPVALIQRCIENSTLPGDTVVDPFGGSGTTLIAAEACGRTALMIELDPRYIDVIVSRWERATGRAPVLTRLTDKEIDGDS